MSGTTTMLVYVILISIALLALLVMRPRITVTKGGKILAFVAFLIFPVLAGSMGITAHIDHSKKTEFCTSCHVMQDYGLSLRIDDRSYIPAVHYQNNLVPREQACFTCHTDYTMYGDFKAKLRGLKHVYVNYIGTPTKPIKLYTPYNNRECLHCHAGSRSFEEGATHNQDPETLPNVKANQLSCSATGCHEFVHNVGGLKDATFWETQKDTTKEENK